MDTSSPFSLLPGVGLDATLLFVHAHPDDETLVTGATMAAYAQGGAKVVVLTCTRGELGEVIPPELAHLEVGRSLRLPDEPVMDRAGDLMEGNLLEGVPLEGDLLEGDLLQGEVAPGAGLAAERERELASALSALGVTEHLWLGQGLTAPTAGPVQFRDSGMKWGPDGRAVAADTVLEGSLSRVPLADLAALGAGAIRALRPDALITYASDGGYGHPDHVRTHQLSMAALKLATVPGDGLPGWRVPHVFAIVSDRPERPLDAGAPRIAVTGNVAAKTAAMEAHRTQITVSGNRYTLSDDVWKDISGLEEFVELATVEIYGSGLP